MRFNFRFMAFLGMILLAAVPGFCQSGAVAGPSTKPAEPQLNGFQRRIMVRLQKQLDATDAQFAVLQPGILRVMDAELKFSTDYSSGGNHPRFTEAALAAGIGSLQPPWGVPPPWLMNPFGEPGNLETWLELGQLAADPGTSDEQLALARLAFEKEWKNSDDELNAAQQDLRNAASLRQCGWLLLDGLIAGSPTNGPGRLTPYSRSKNLEAVKDGIDASLGSGDERWTLTRPKIEKIIDNELGPIGGTTVLFSPSGRPVPVPSADDSQFQKAVEEVRKLLNDPQSTDAMLQAKIESALKVKEESDKAYAAAQADLRSIALSPREEAVLVVDGILTAHHR